MLRKMEGPGLKTKKEFVCGRAVYQMLKGLWIYELYLQIYIEPLRRQKQHLYIALLKGSKPE